MIKAVFKTIIMYPVFGTLILGLLKVDRTITEQKCKGTLRARVHRASRCAIRN